MSILPPEPPASPDRSAVPGAAGSPLPPPDRPVPTLAESEPEALGEHGRVGYGRFGRHTPLILAIIMLLILVVIGWQQWRGEQPPPAPRPGQLIGTPAPAATLTLLDGTPLALRDQRGSVVVLNFWASWCEPCRREMPMLELVQLEADLTGAATKVIGVGVRTDQDAAARTLVQSLGLTYAIGRDAATDQPGIGPIEHAFGLTGSYPATVIIRPDGLVDQVLLGELTMPQVQAAIDQARNAR